MYFDFNVIFAYKELLFLGLLLTLQISFFVILLGTILGIVLSFGKLSKNKLINFLSSFYSDFFRAMPILVMLIWVYYALPILINLRITAFETGVIVLSLHLSAYVGELLRSGIIAIPKGQIEAAKSLGLNSFQIMQRIVFPQVFRQILSPLTGLYIEQMKNTTLLSVIAINELLHTGQILITQTYKPLEIYTVIALLFVFIFLPLFYISKRFELSSFIKKTQGV